jgi:hypothetical protein
MMEKINGIVYKIHANPSPAATVDFFVQEYPPAPDGNLAIGKILFLGSKAQCIEFLDSLR